MCAAASPAFAIDIQNFNPAIGNQNLVTLYSSSPLANGQFGVSVIANYARNPLIFDLPSDEEEELRVVEDMVQTEFQAAVGVLDRLDIGLAYGFATVRGEQMDEQLTPAFPETTLETDTGSTDMRAALKLMILENEPGSLGLAVVGLASFPTGNEDTYSGAGATNGGARLIIDKRFERVNIVVNGGYVAMGDPDPEDEELDEELRFDPTGRAEFGAGVTIMAHEYVELLAEIYGRTVDYGLEIIDPETPVEAIGAVKLFIGPVHLLAGGGAGVNAGMGNPAGRGFAGLAFTWPELDRKPPRGGTRTVVVQQVAPAARMDEDSDRDGLLSSDEIRIHRTDPINPDTDGDGLKDGEEVNKYKTDPLKDDTDGDGLIDFEEVKVYYTNPHRVDTDGDTLGDGAEVKQYRTSPIETDTDADGVPDNLDAAPSNPKPSTAFSTRTAFPRSSRRASPPASP
ncbi:MAG: hypothetical protein M5R36_18195 [Deltaproteobacteria bacterium]|nr:hypothetical protein [Deltaproteobacteria bacterium]